MEQHAESGTTGVPRSARPHDAVIVTLIQRAMDEWRRAYDPADTGPTMAEAVLEGIRSAGFVVVPVAFTSTEGGNA